MQLETYWVLTRRPLLNLWFLLPLLAFFHIGNAFLPSTSRAPNDVLRFLGYFGAVGALLPAGLIVATLLIQVHMRKDRWELRPGVLGLMSLESLVWAGPFIVLAQVAARRRPVGGGEFLGKAIDAVGAGIYEEFLFRVVFLSAVLGFFVDLLRLRRDLFACIGVIAGAVLFALYHFTPITAQAFNWPEFNFLTAVGLLWGIAYVTRGFAVAVGAHVFYNLYYILTRLSF